ncbi:MAG: hypothetical protein Q9222_002447 [Ikaeria aurantiellina]
MKPPFPSPVPTWHNDSYDAISPRRAELSSTGKTVIITGAGGTIGRETAKAFAVAGAARLVLIGRTESTLKATEEAVKESNKSTIACLVFTADITDEKAMTRIAAEVGTWDIFILNAGHLPKPGPIASTNVSEYWAAYEVSSLAHCSQISFLQSATAFLVTANKAHAAMLGSTAGALVLPPTTTPGLSAYLTSKIAAAKTLEWLAAENPNVFVASVHPGMIDTAIFRKSGATPEVLPMDSGELSSRFLYAFLHYCVAKV